MKRIFTVLILTAMLSQSAYACGNYTQIRTENYNASSPTGYFYTTKGNTSFYQPENYGNNVYPVNYTIAQAPEVSAQYIDTPQSYQHQVVNTYRDEREGIDKAIDRSGKIVGILGIGALLGVGVAALINSF